jgi:hypothetical protein
MGRVGEAIFSNIQYSSSINKLVGHAPELAGHMVACRNSTVTVTVITVTVPIVHPSRLRLPSPSCLPSPSNAPRSESGPSCGCAPVAVTVTVVVAVAVAFAVSVVVAVAVAVEVADLLHFKLFLRRPAGGVSRVSPAGVAWHLRVCWGERRGVGQFGGGGAIGSEGEGGERRLRIEKHMRSSCSGGLDMVRPRSNEPLPPVAACPV